LSNWDIKRVIGQIAGRDFAKSVLEKELESNDRTVRDLTRGISVQWGGKFREKFVARQGHSWQAERAIEAIYLANTDTDIEAAFTSAFVAHLLTQQVSMISDFLDFLGIAHQEGNFNEEGVTKFDETKVEKAIAEISETYSLFNVRMYLAVAGIRNEFWATSLWAGLDQLSEGGNVSDRGEISEISERLPDAVTPVNSSILDDLMTKAIVDSVGDAGGAFPVRFIEDAIDELITMNISRSQSYFHRGFFHALTGTEDRTPSLEDNESRRRWELVGEIFGLARLTEPEKLVACWSSNSTELGRLMTERHPAGPRILPVLFNALWDADLHSDALGLLRPEVLATCTDEFKQELLNAARSHRVKGLVDDARIIADALWAAVKVGEGVEREFVGELLRERAVCMRTQGHFQDAIELLEYMLEDSFDELQGDLEGLLGLCKANFRRVSEVTCLVEADQVNSSVDRLREQKMHFQKAANSDHPLAIAIGNHCLGVLAFLESETETAVDHLSSAYSAAIRSAQMNTNGAFIGQIQTSLALAIVVEADETRFHQASDLLSSANITKLVIPEWVASRMIDNVVLISDESTRSELLVALVNYSPGSIDHLLQQTSEATNLVPDKILAEVIDASESTSTDMVDRWSYSAWLAARYISVGELDNASRYLDLLESMAFERPRFRAPFIELLNTDRKFDGAWSSEDVTWSLVGIHEREADYEGAIRVLRSQFHTYAAEENWPQAFGIYERASKYALPSELLEDMEGRLRGEFQTTEMPSAEELDKTIDEPVKILFVGGNEIHQKYDEGIRKNLAESAPWITVDFEHPGWGGNWGDTADRLRNRFTDYDALVVMTLIRTNLGRALRKHTNATGLVWTSCTGAGRQFIERSIIDCGVLAQKKRHNGST
jgi:tetratricopeptide (TPR) repeat protein